MQEFVHQLCRNSDNSRRNSYIVNGSSMVLSPHTHTTSSFWSLFCTVHLSKQPQFPATTSKDVFQLDHLRPIRKLFMF